jgi:hypothetical protein
VLSPVSSTVLEEGPPFWLILFRKFCRSAVAVGSSLRFSGSYRRLDFLTGLLRSVEPGFVGEEEEDCLSVSGGGVLEGFRELSFLFSSTTSAGPVPLSILIETSLREPAAIAALSSFSWRRLAFLPMLPFGAGERGLSSTWRFVEVGIEMVSVGRGAAGGVAVRGIGVAGFVVGRDWA